MWGVPWTRWCSGSPFAFIRLSRRPTFWRPRHPGDLRKTPIGSFARDVCLVPNVGEPRHQRRPCIVGQPDIKIASEGP